ncbi:MAG: RHS repeat-associated core domain-containing protein [Chloroflexi bacterium]|nr:RHS repeat-associated core domain-containing protein [Chloroflexota bacterium]
MTRTYATDDTGRIVEVCDPDCATGTIYVVVYNGHGDATGLWKQETTGALTLANSYTYSTWGTPTITVNTGAGFTDLRFRFLYVGSSDVQWDSSFGLNLGYMHARHFSPTLGRFIQPDPSAAEKNLYGYAQESPVTNSDPTGLYFRTRAGLFFTLHRPSLRRAAYYAYVLGRISYRSYYLFYYATIIRYRNRTFRQTVYFAPQDSCIGATVAGGVGLAAMGAIDAAVGFANVFAIAAGGIGEVAMLPVDAGAFAATNGFYVIVEQSTHNNCDDIHWKWFWEP